MDHRSLVPRQYLGTPLPLQPPEYMAENHAPHLRAIEGYLFTLSMSVILMRLYIRIFILKKFGWDDWMMVASGVMCITCFAIFIHVIHLGLGRHIEAFPPENFLPFFRIMYFYSIAIILAYSFIKLSIGFFLLRLVDYTRWRPFLIGMQIFIILFTIVSTFSIIFQCIPVQAGYDYSLRPPYGTAKCYNQNIFRNIGVFNSSINIATDLIFALLPIPMVWRLQLNLRTRIGLAIVLSLGLFASAVAIYKTPMQYNFFKQPDFSGNGAGYYVWQQVEMHVGIQAACLPTLKPLFASFFGRFRGLTKGRSTESSDVYVRHDERGGYIMGNSGGERRVVFGEDGLLAKDECSLQMEARLSGADEGEESILSHGGRSNGLEILRTTEVIVTEEAR
ncbi:hypothetical protein HBI70_096550 [Parastagonospora nodorum]|nr:hypothetical protein HBI79_161510 [Parastagonospora nodorum]KAH5174442.1 hypothetical protein HBH77_207210 [Parastagonospora nodorum]KAH5245435.1 hypothetical protein HBI71_188240 [Parastagonospora nodorum]KAH5277292.1 hypothetical protein HBI70_096550 [Parastagonospora nodorum]KAH5372388.1 hypothetical protein HBI49_061350 [Parastagonospora nodorum]